MQPQFVESRRVIRGKRESINWYTRLPQFENENHPIELCYRGAADALEHYIRNTELPKLDDAWEHTQRKNRLHRIHPSISYICQGNWEEDRYLSITLKMIRIDCNGTMQLESFRVWVIQNKCLCPIDFFCSSKESKQYDRWEFALRNGELWAMPRCKKIGDVYQLKKIGISKNA